MASFKEFLKFGFNYYLVVTHMNLINIASKFEETKNLADKLHTTFIVPLFQIIKTKLAGEDHIYFKEIYDDLTLKE